MQDIKVILLVILFIITMALTYFILIGKFCYCSTITCPNSSDPLRSYLT